MPVYDGRKRSGAIEILEAWGHFEDWEQYSDYAIIEWVELMGYAWKEETKCWVNLETESE